MILKNLGYFWVQSNTRAALPPNAVPGGKDSDGSPIYIGLATHQGDELPVKIVPRRHEAYVCYAGKEVPVSNYKVSAVIH